MVVVIRARLCKTRRCIKIFEKALKDPNSPEAQGIQQAYQDVQRQDMQKQQQQLLQQQMQEAQMRMRQMAAQAQNQQSLAAIARTFGRSN